MRRNLRVADSSFDGLSGSKTAAEPSLPNGMSRCTSTPTERAATRNLPPPRGRSVCRVPKSWTPVKEGITLEKDV